MKNLRIFRAACLLCGILAAPLLAGTAATAQATAQNVPDSDGSASSRPRTPLTSVRLPEVVSDSMGVDFTPYFQESVLPSVRPNWRAMARQKGLAPSNGRKIVAEFTILKDGSLNGLKLAEGSGDPGADQAALDAITNSAPFAALPAEFKGESLAVRCRLDVFLANPNGVTPNGLTPPRLIQNVNAEFSDEARRKKIEGVVTLSLVVDTEGQPTDVQVVASLGHGLDEKAVEAVKQWRFQPAMRDGNPVSTKIKVDVNFRLLK
jgi:TonB family protein